MRTLRWRIRMPTGGRQRRSPNSLTVLVLTLMTPLVLVLVPSMLNLQISSIVTRRPRGSWLPQTRIFVFGEPPSQPRLAAYSLYPFVILFMTLLTRSTIKLVNLISATAHGWTCLNLTIPRTTPIRIALILSSASRLEDFLPELPTGSSSHGTVPSGGRRANSSRLLLGCSVPSDSCGLDDGPPFFNLSLLKGS